MPAVDTVLLPLCVGLTLLGVIVTGVAWRRGNKGRVVQGVGLALAPIALYFSGLLRLLWNAVVALGTWASTLIFSPLIWFGHLPARTVHRALGGRRHGRPPHCSGAKATKAAPAHRPPPRCRPRARRAARPPASRPRSTRRWPRSRHCSSPAASSESFRFVSIELGSPGISAAE